MKKKVIALILSATLTLSACGSASNNSTNTTSDEPAANAVENTDSSSDDKADTSSGTDNSDSAKENTDSSTETTGSDAAKADADNSTDATGSDAAKDNADSSTDANGSDSASDEISLNDVSLLWEDSRVFLGTSLGSYYVMPTYSVKGYEDVPFVKAGDYANIFFENKAFPTYENGIMTIRKNDAEATIDTVKNTVYISNPARFRSVGICDGAIVETKEMNVVTASVKNASSQEDPKPLTIELDDYDMPVFEYDGDVVMPFLALQNTLGAIAWNNVYAYNGKDYFNLYSANDYIMNHSDINIDENPFLHAVYSGPFSEKGSPTQDYAKYSYYSSCLLLDLYYGHKKEKNITTFDEYFTRTNLKNVLCSTNLSDVSMAEMLVFLYLFDSGHDAFIPGRSVFGEVQSADADAANDIIDDIKNSEEGKEMFSSESSDIEGEDDSIEDYLGDAVLGALMEKGLKVPDLAPLSAWTLYFEKKAPKDYGTERLDYVDDTAIIFFNVFKDNPDRDPSFYLEPMTEDDYADNNFAFFYSCFEDIKKHDEVKNVVINLSSNGGGAASALIAILGFMSKDGEVKITDLDITSNSYREECYHVDTNLDGIADDNDGYGGQYDFFIMTSPSSYSCGNALPYFAQQNGLAKIIGAKPGGGDCVVGNYMDAYGLGGSFSGMLKLGKMENGEFISDESVTEPDYNMLPSMLNFNSVPWFDPEGIAKAVHECKEGKTESTYSAIENADALANALVDILNISEGGNDEETEEDDE